MLRLAALLALPCILTAADDEQRKQLAYTRAHYTKYEYRIPMRDGVRLFATVYVPKDSGEKYPILMQRTPYSVAPYGVDNYRNIVGPSEAAEKEGFIFVYEDVRGRYMSEGTFVDVRPHKAKLDGARDFDDSTDTYDTVEWLIHNVPNNNGKAGIWGISYPGHYAAHALIDSHPALKAVSPQAPMGDLADGDDAYHNGAFYLGANFQFYAQFEPRKQDLEKRSQRWGNFEPGTYDAYTFFLGLGPLNEAARKFFKQDNAYWEDQIGHATYDDFWRGRSLTPHMKNVKPAAMFVGGWFDAEDLAGPLKLYTALEKNGPIAPNTLVMGPWSHGGWARNGPADSLGNLRFDTNTGEYFREQIELPFFVEQLKDKPHDPKIPKFGDAKAIVFETGRNEWHRFDHWPPKGATARSLFLNAEGKLAWSAGAAGFDEYLSDPAHPVPTTAAITDGFGMPGDYMTYDQRFASERPDVLTYETEPLERDVTIAGPVTPSLRVSTTGTDSDFVVKLIDVYPDDYPDPDPNPRRVHMGGYQQLVRGEPFRGKFRAGFSKPEPFTPGKPEKIEYWMPDVFHTFKTGHRIMVQIQSSWFPLTDRNPQQFLDIPKAKPADFKKATQRVYRGGDGSQIKLLVVE